MLSQFGSESGSMEAAESKARKQSRMAQFNQLSKAPTNLQHHRRTSSSTGRGLASSVYVQPNEVSDSTDPVSAETPSITPVQGPSRVESNVSLSSLVRSTALDDDPKPAICEQKVEFKLEPKPDLKTEPVTRPSAMTTARQPPTSASASIDTPFPVKEVPVSSASVNAPSSTEPLSAQAQSEYEGSLPRVGSTKRFRAMTLDVPGLTRSKISPDGRIAKADVAAKLVVVMVGLPARGKSYITKKLSRFLNWQQHDCRIFNVGNTRRRASRHVGPAKKPLPDSPATSEHEGDFFSPDNPDSVAQREKWAEDTLSELLDYVLDGEGSVGILDATNTTQLRRKRVMSIIDKRSKGQLKVLFLESVCTQRNIIESNVRLKLSGPDYKHMDQKKAIDDFLLRLRNYEKAYEPISSEEEANPKFQYVKFINVGQKFECGNIKGFLAGQTVFFLLNFNLQPRQIWITRHGESTDNQLGKIGGDAGLTERGKKYSAALARFMRYKKQEFKKRLAKEAEERMEILRSTGSQPATPDNEPEEQNFCVWASMLRRAIETASYFEDSEFDLKEMRMLNELDPGIFDGMTYEQIKEQFPNEYEARMCDKLRYRYPGIGGESYLDVINRLRPVIVEIERMEDNCMVICHRVVARVLLSYFMNLGRDAIGDLEVPLHTLYVLEPKPYGVDWALYKYNERFDWFHEVSTEEAQVQSQLNDHKRRYTVVATAGIQLGFDELRQNPEGAAESAIASGDEDEDADDGNTSGIKSKGDGLHMQARKSKNSCLSQQTSSSQDSSVMKDLEQALEKRFASEK